jgi:D-3-phosphoglycerate dehydrogenase
MAKLKVVVTDLGYPNYDSERSQVEAIGGELHLAECKTARDVAKATADADGVLNRAAPVTADAIAAMQRCRAIARYGIGVDNVDVQAATKKGIVVANVPGYCVEEVTDHALALMLAAWRKVVSHDKATRRGAWDISFRDPVYRLRGRTLGLLGLGAIARRLVEKVAGFGFHIIAFDPFVPPEAASRLRVTLVDLDTLFRESDLLSIHAPATAQTRHMVNGERLGQMKPTAVLVNTSRGPLIDEAALVEALKAKRIAAAALDVYEQEPPDRKGELFQLDNAIVTDHAAWYSEDSLAELQRRCAAAVCAVLTGKRPESPVNPEVLERLGIK